MYTDVTEYVIAAQGGDREAYDQVVKHTTRGIYVFALQKVRNHHAAVDLVDETFVNAWLRLDQLRNPATFFPWARTICLRLILTRNRKRLIHQLESEVAERQISKEGSPGELLEQDEERELLYEAIGNSQYSNILIAHYFHGKTYKEIGELTNTLEGTVRSRLHVARSRLRESLTNSD